MLISLITKDLFLLRARTKRCVDIKEQRLSYQEYSSFTRLKAAVKVNLEP